MNISKRCVLCRRAFVSRCITTKEILAFQTRNSSTEAEQTLSTGSVREKLTLDSCERRRKRREVLDKILRVDHAGEIGANFIYKGQLRALGKDSSAASVIQDMWSHEQKHLNILEQLMPKERTRPSLLRPLWQCAGYTLGVASGLMGEKAAMACTDAVEEAIVDHYNDQIRVLLEKQNENEDDYEDIAKILSKMRDEEQHHMDLSKEHNSESAPFYSVMKNVIKTGCKVAILTAEKV
ncbi:NADPH-dependent 3-demethoxyubiquinone 3-hydroxylase, mitochondrial-like [Convolutriloba macropyga]|uniref:NADPH-dependent 3-demethoxyubiquinone 3-hydroxylase, mitochondrial-like n=1 Tax=Convolutriloba macropyga TaxID=536237 RepID=UPI003F52508C